MYQPMRHWLTAAAVASTLFGGAARAAEPTTFDVGTMHVQQYGAAAAPTGRPLILIPGLASGSWAWDDTTRRFAASHAVYVVTLAGFDGRPPVPGPQLAQAQAALLELITARKLDKPVLIGHSLGGMLGLAFAEQHADLIAGVVSVDGLPVYPGTEAVPPPQRQQMADVTSSGMRSVTPAQFAAQQQAYMRGTGVQDMDLADTLAVRSASSDPATVATYMDEVLAADYRPALASITVPVLLVAPYSAGDSAPYQITEAAKLAYYRSLMAGTPLLDVESIAPARHFAMIDQPELFGDMLDAYLKKLP